MGKKLDEAAIKVRKNMVKQKQGTCGLYSLWYATLLLAEIDSNNKKLIYPRSMKNADKSDTAFQTSRSFQKGLNGGQGEVLSQTEMEMIISHFGWKSEAHNDSSGRDSFITKQLAAEAPVLVPYMHGNAAYGNKPITSLALAISLFNSGSRGFYDYGPHWCLLISENSDEYIVINPHDPTADQKWLKKLLLDSNSFVDDYKLPRYFIKNGENIYPSTSQPSNTDGTAMEVKGRADSQGSQSLLSPTMGLSLFGSRVEIPNTKPMPLTVEAAQTSGSHLTTEGNKHAVVPAEPKDEKTVFTTQSLPQKPAQSAVSPEKLKTRYYDLGEKRKQELKNVLISVIGSA